MLLAACKSRHGQIYNHLANINFNLRAFRITWDSVDGMWNVTKTGAEFSSTTRTRINKSSSFATQHANKDWILILMNFGLCYGSFLRVFAILAKRSSQVTWNMKFAVIWRLQIMLASLRTLRMKQKHFSAVFIDSNVLINVCNVW